MCASCVTFRRDCSWLVHAVSGAAGGAQRAAKMLRVQGREEKNVRSLRRSVLSTLRTFGRTDRERRGGREQRHFPGNYFQHIQRALTTARREWFAITERARTASWSKRETVLATMREKKERSTGARQTFWARPPCNVLLPLGVQKKTAPWTRVKKQRYDPRMFYETRRRSRFAVYSM